jgi:hypothetical protein
MQPSQPAGEWLAQAPAGDRLGEAAELGLEAEVLAETAAVEKNVERTPALGV